jgi:hypothetical protein
VVLPQAAVLLSMSCSAASHKFRQDAPSGPLQVLDRISGCQSFAGPVKCRLICSIQAIPRISQDSDSQLSSSIH